jgi:IPT/TIG domain
MVVLVAFAVALLPAYAHATTVTIGNPNLAAANSEIMCSPCGAGSTSAQGFISETAPYFAPAAGVITHWRVRGAGTLKLHVLESGGEGGWIGKGTSAAATNTNGESNAANLPIGAGDLIGVDFPSEPLSGAIRYQELATAEILDIHPALSDNGPELEATRLEGALALNAEVVLTPVMSSLSPAAGSTTGGNAVTIGGRFLDGATSVTFGSMPASGFSVDSSTQAAWTSRRAAVEPVPPGPRPSY